MAVTTTHTLSLTRRPRRLRRTEAIRSLVRETRLTPDCFIYPLFVCEGEGVRREVGSMPGVFQLSVDEAVKEAAAAKADGVPGGDPVRPAGEQGRRRIARRPIPKRRCRTPCARSSARCRDLVVMTDVCLCEYTSHGHCGIVEGEEIVNDATVAHLAQAALSHAVAGADFVAPSDMMDGRVARDPPARSTSAASTASASCRTRRSTAPASTVRSARPPTRRRSSAIGAAIRWIRPTSRRRCARWRSTSQEGADIVMVKPALPYLDVLAKVKERFGQPTAAYHVSGEYAMLKAAAQRGWIDEPRVMMETLIGIRRAGADMIITYYAREAARCCSRPDRTQDSDCAETQSDH